MKNTETRRMRPTISTLSALLAGCMLFASCANDAPKDTTGAAGTSTPSVTTTQPSTAGTDAPNAIYDADDVNFAVISDIHIGRTGLSSSPDKKLGKALDTINRELGTPDAILVVGDLTENGEDSQYKTYKKVVDKYVKEETVLASVMGNHEYHRSNHSASAKDCQNAYLKNIGGELHSDTVINGVHMIGLSPLTLMGDYTAATDYLDEHVRAAAAEDPNMPIIVYTHWGFSEVYDTEGSTFGKKLDALLAEFPQIIAFSGHMHYSLRDPRMILQKNITTIQTSTVGSDYWNYSYMDPSQPEGAGDASEGLFVSVSSDRVVTVRRYDFTKDCYIGNPWVINTPEIVKSKDNFTYTESARVAKAAAPTFADDATIEISGITSRSAKFVIPTATVVDDVSDGCIIGYNVEIKQKGSDNAVYSKYIINNWQEIERATNDLELSFTALSSDTTYIVTVVAESAWGIKSKELSAEFTTKNVDGDPLPLPNKILDVDFSSASADDTASGINALVQGNPKLEEGMAIFNDSCYGYLLDADLLERLSQNLSVEMIVYLDEIQPAYPWGYASVFGCAQGAGFDVCLYDNGNLSFDLYMDGRWQTINAEAPLGRWAHIVVTFDGELMCFYIDGALVESMEYAGKINQPVGASQVFYFAADVDGDGNGEYPTTMKSTGFTLYEGALSADQVADRCLRANIPQN